MGRFQASDLYVVITESFCTRPAIEVLEAVLRAGVRLVQFREKDIDAGDLYRRAKAFREMTDRYDALLIVDDRVDIALAVDADGVHLGQSDLPIAVARQVAPELILGASSHNLAEALDAQAQGASYTNIGPIFPTNTKSVPTGAVGPEMLDLVTPHLSIPYTCMGGIKLDNIDAVLRKGAHHIAMVTAVTGADDPEAAATELRAKILQYQKTEA
jgi:thiamine-phosphate pyrophosphorylase